MWGIVLGAAIWFVAAVLFAVFFGKWAKAGRGYDDEEGPPC